MRNRPSWTLCASSVGVQYEYTLDGRSAVSVAARGQYGKVCSTRGRHKTRNWAAVVRADPGLSH